MKKNWRNKIILSFFIAMVITVVACNKHEHADHSDTYTCPMHPTVVADKPGTCPVCGMDLVRKSRPGEEVAMTEELSGSLKSPNESVIASIRTTRGEFKSLAVNTKAQGIVTYDTRSLFAIPSRVAGRLEKVFVKYPYQQIARGQKVAEIYSPELVMAQRELLFIAEQDAGNEPLLNAAKQKLMLLGFSESQINKLLQRKEAETTFPIYSTRDGYVVPVDQAAPSSAVIGPTSSGMKEGMSAPGVSTTRTSDSIDDLLREGNYVSAGQVFFKVVNASALRVELNVAASLGNTIKKGDEVTLDFGNNDLQSSTVDLVQPFFNAGQEFITIRVFTHHTDKLHIGHLVNAELKSNSIEGLWVPVEAVVDLGVNKVVFIKDRKVFKPKEVTTGVATAGMIQIVHGLSSQDEIAVNGQYLVDSESFIKPQP
jgi:hypothetical protein